MRILLAGSAKTGNVWVENILSLIYDLKVLVPPFIPERNYQSYIDFIEQGLFEDNSIFHQHFDYSTELCEASNALPCHIITVIRNPYDVFVSLYYYIQNFSSSFITANHAGSMAIGKPIDHPDVLRFLEENFRNQLMRSISWMQSGRALIVRYEDVHRDALDTIRKLTENIENVEDSTILKSIELCTASRMRTRGEWMEKHIRSAVTGDWQNHLSKVHLDIFRSSHADLIESLGYEVH